MLILAEKHATVAVKSISLYDGRIPPWYRSVGPNQVNARRYPIPTDQCSLMFFSGRKMLPYLALAIFAAAVAWAVSFKKLPPADLTFWNETEIESVDPQIVTGVPDARIVMALFEGLVNWEPKTLKAIPGVAESWEISADKKVYTFHLRKSAQWSDGTPVTAQDFFWSWRRLLSPTTESKYVYQMSRYIKNAKKYNAAEVEVGDPVEVEFENRNADLPGARGEVLTGKLIEIKKVPRDSKPKETVDIYTVEIGTTKRRFCPEPQSNCESCVQVLLDFEQVGIKIPTDENGQPTKHEIELTINGPTPYFIELCGFHTLYPVHRASIEKHGAPNWKKAGNLVSNGAYTLEYRRLRDRLRLAKNPHYWNATEVKLNVIEACPVPSDTTALAMYLTGKLDWTTNVPSSVLADMQQQRPDEFHPSDEYSTNFYRINVTDPILKDVRIRQALAMAVDRKQIIDAVGKMNEKPALSLVPPMRPEYTPARCEEPNLAKAKQLLAEAGYPDGKNFPHLEILFNENDDHLITAELLQYQWKKNLGISFGIRALEWGSYLKSQEKLEYNVCRAGWTADYLDAATFIGIFITGGEDNETGWGNSEYDKFVELAGSEYDDVKRSEYLAQAEKILMTEMPIIPLYYRKSKNVFHERVVKRNESPIERRIV